MIHVFVGDIFYKLVVICDADQLIVLNGFFLNGITPQN
ncbi:hypothetical protein yaldo0001_35680 [Yersinia aldovae ATCC 35236]|nr:hypothetical protein yaldo0001_35680 [Yersinia aldovae ATCC 35236]